MQTKDRTLAPPDKGCCLAAELAALMEHDARLEAIQLDCRKQTVRVASSKDFPELGDRVAQLIQEKGQKAASSGCSWMGGETDCEHCQTGIPAEARAHFDFKQEPSGGIISRKLGGRKADWKWNEIRLPHLRLPHYVQRDSEFLQSRGKANEWKWQLLASIACGGSGLLGAFVFDGSVFCYAIAYICGAIFPLVETWEQLRQWKLDIHFLMIAVAAGSASIGAWGEGAALLFLFSFSTALEHYAMARTQKELQALYKSAPKTALVLDPDGQEHELPVEELVPGLKLLIQPGMQFPVDCEITRGLTAADESTLTGEAAPVPKAIGDSVFAGTTNLWGSVETAVLRPAAESALSKIVRLIESAQQQKAPTQRFAERFTRSYTYVVLLMTAAMFLVWWLGFRLPLTSAANPENTAFYRAMVLLVVASPCALVLSIPSAVLAAIARGARRGIIFRGGIAVEKLAEIRAVAMDKTGTLTTGELRVDHVESFPPGGENVVERAAFSMERLSQHPLARAITRHGKQKKLAPMSFDHFESIPGRGLHARKGDDDFVVGNRKLVDDALTAAHLQVVAPPSDPASAEIWVKAGSILGRILLRDEIREAAKWTLESLRERGLKLVVLTGDRKAAAEQFKSRLNMDDVRAELLPEQKLEVIGDFARRGEYIAMIGDGVNDAPSLAAAHVGVAMGARGSDAALEQADVILMHDRLENFISAFELSRSARAVIRQNLVFSIGSVLVLVSLALLADIPLTLGVFGHEGSTVAVVLNSLRLLLTNHEQLP